MSFSENFNKIKPLFAGLIVIGTPIKKQLGSGEVVGYNCYTNSIIAKDIKLKRVQAIIDFYELQMVIVEPIAHTTHFQIKEKHL